ncbi:MAG: cytochrome oxidase small assembly protein [Leptothrix sp. (in: Bacteria)]|mgnify:FL=1|jgi:hypothetical protein|nr:cytochrome oxidase small assembly protein [Leptothrix sp. (in: b-proteobacteria)]
MSDLRDPRSSQGKSNLRLALVLASVALVFFAGFVAKIVLFGR